VEQLNSVRKVFSLLGDVRAQDYLLAWNLLLTIKKYFAGAADKGGA
jgi:hypothetical protein